MKKIGLVVVSIQDFGTEVYHYRLEGNDATTGSHHTVQLSPNLPQEAILEVPRHTCAIRSVAILPELGGVIEIQHYQLHQ